MWREERGYPIGLHRGNPLGSRLAMPWARETLGNYLTDAIRAVVRHEVFDPSTSAGKLYARPRIFSDLLSSQPLCFNLFAELQQNLELASAVFHTLTAGRIAQVTAIEFEYSPGPGAILIRGSLRFTCRENLIYYDCSSCRGPRCQHSCPVNLGVWKDEYTCHSPPGSAVNPREAKEKEEMVCALFGGLSGDRHASPATRWRQGFNGGPGLDVDGVANRTCAARGLLGKSQRS